MCRKVHGSIRFEWHVWFLGGRDPSDKRSFMSRFAFSKRKVWDNSVLDVSYSVFSVKVNYWVQVCSVCRLQLNEAEKACRTGIITLGILHLPLNGIMVSTNLTTAFLLTGGGWTNISTVSSRQMNGLLFTVKEKSCADCGIEGYENTSWKRMTQHKNWRGLKRARNIFMYVISLFNYKEAFLNKHFYKMP